MPALPLLLEQSSRWYSFAGPLAGVLLLVAGIALWFGWRRGLANMKSSNLVALLATVAIALWALVLPLGWEFRLDKDGVALSAPFDPMADKGRIAWRDLKAAQFGARDGVPTLEFLSDKGKITLDTLEQVPAAFWPAMAATIEANAPAALKPNAAEWLAQAKQKAAPLSGQMMLQGYVAKDGSGNELK
jgi:hypothetical protein